jgi:hypothetical protein
MNSNMPKQFPALFLATDCFGKNIFHDMDKDIQVNLVSCQFAFHYAFETEERLRAAFER